MGFADVINHQHYDIALVKLSRNATLDNYVQIANMAEKGSNFIGQECVQSGWGELRGGVYPDLLREVCDIYVNLMFRSTI